MQRAHRIEKHLLLCTDTMTVVNGIEIDNISCGRNETRAAIGNNDPITDKLHVVAVVSNPRQYARRYILAREFVRRMELEPDVVLYVVELAHAASGKGAFHVTSPTNPRHLRLTTGEQALWHKENLINIGVRRLLSADWKAFAWIDADVEFESPEWASHALRLLNGSKDVVQLFSHAVDMDLNEDAMSIFASFGYQLEKGRAYVSGAPATRLWHPGFAWACSRKAYDRMGGLFEASVLGSGDNNMALSFVGRGRTSLNADVHPDYMEALLAFQRRAAGLRVGYVPGVIRHHFHGNKKNRRYSDRWQVLVRWGYSPRLHVTKDAAGILVPSAACPKGLLQDITEYFEQRNEDEGIKS